jgi:hypothetical protein
MAVGIKFPSLKINSERSLNTALSSEVPIPDQIVLFDYLSAPPVCPHI